MSLVQSTTLFTISSITWFGSNFAERVFSESIFFEYVYFENVFKKDMLAIYLSQVMSIVSFYFWTKLAVGKMLSRREKNCFEACSATTYT